MPPTPPGSLPPGDPHDGGYEGLIDDLHEGPAQTLVAIHLLASRFVEELPSDSPWAPRLQRLAHLAKQGNWATDQVLRGLGSWPQVPGGLTKAVRDLCRSFQEDSGMGVIFREAGSGGRSSLEAERALYRVVHEALINCWLHARCLTIVVKLTYRDRDMSVSVADDGIGLSLRWDRRATRSGIGTMRRTLARVGGRLRVLSASPRGVVIHARVPRRGP